MYLNGAARWLSVSLQPPSQLQLRSLRPATSNTGTRDCRACIHAKARHSFSTPRIGLRNRISASVFSIEGWQPRAPAPGDRPTAASPFGRLTTRLVKTLSVSQRLCIAVDLPKIGRYSFGTLMFVSSWFEGGFELPRKFRRMDEIISRCL